VTAQNVAPILARHAHTDSRFNTDESPLYHGLGWNFAEHGVVNHSKKEYAIGKGDALVTTNTVEGYFSILKRGITGVYHHVSEAHLHRYLAEFDFRYSNRVKLGISDLQRADIALKGVRGKRLTYETTRSKRTEGTAA
jgi:hypothetical protein